MKYQTVYDRIKVAGYHDDQQSYARLYCENRISMPKAREAFEKGKQARKAGVKCTCRECSQ